MLSISVFPSYTSKKILSYDEVFAILAHKKIYYYKKGDIILSEQLGRRLYLVVEGKVKVKSTVVSGKTVVQDIMGKGEVIGGFADSSVRPNTYVEIASSEASVMPIHRQEFFRLLESVQTYVFYMMNQRIQRLEKQLEIRSRHDADQRVIALLCYFGQRFGRRAGFETRIDHGLTHGEMGCMVGTSRQTLTTVLAGLRRKNLINYNRRYILIRDLSALENINTQEQEILG